MSMHFNRCTPVLAGLMACGSLPAQSEEDALRWSFTQEGGTARSAAMANAFGALGADPVSAWINPAGIGLTVASEFSLTPSFEVNDAGSTYYNTTAANTATRFYFSNFSLLLHAPSENRSGWRAGNFGIAYDRQATYHWNRQVEGANVPSSILHAFVNEANGTSPDDLFAAYAFTSGLAWDTYGIDPSGTGANTYVAAVPDGIPSRHARSSESNGRVSNTAFFFGANYDDRWYFGASLGVIGARFTRTTVHTESNTDATVDLKDLSYREDLTTTGNGVDVRVGVIGRVTDRLRAGASYHSPSWMALDDVFVTEMRTGFRTQDSSGNYSYTAYSPEGVYSYRLRTPMSAVGSLAYVVGQHGAISIDYEWKDYRTARLRSASDLDLPDSLVYDFGVENELVRNSAAVSHSVRVGTEWKAGPWRFRAGWGIWPDPYAKTDARHGLPLTRYTGGIGWRNERVSIDFAAQYDARGSSYFLYDPSEVAPVSENLTNMRAMVTFAWRP